MRKDMISKTLSIGIVILFIGIFIIPSSGIQTNNNIINQTNYNIIIQKNKGKTLYVGGNGTGNYSSIQDAINDANPGDTVFVFDDSSPYIDYDIQINKSINLIGEDKNTTVLNSWGDDVIEVNADWVNISGFSMIDTRRGVITNEAVKNIKISDNHFIDCTNCIYLNSDKSYIISNTFKDCKYGIFITSDKCFIISNTFSKFKYAIFLLSYSYDSYDITIYDNFFNSTKENPDNYSGDITIFDGGVNFSIINNTFICRTGQYRTGIYAPGLVDSIINGNKFIGYFEAIYLDAIWFRDLIISYNNFTDNYCGIAFKNAIGSGQGIKVNNNNFIENLYDIHFIIICGFNSCDSNYWDNWIGFRIKLPIFQKFPKIVRGSFISITIDWHPAKEPYDI
jgi:parallel beta-helix repeat protein